MGRNLFSHVVMTVVMKVVYSCVFTFLFLALTACSAGEGKAGQTRSIGIDGYVYVAEKISGEGGISQEDSLFSYAYGMEVPEVPFYPSNLFVRDGEGNFYFLSCNYSPYGNNGMRIETPEHIYTISDGGLMISKPGEKEASMTRNLEKIEAARALAHTVLYKTSAQGEILYELDLTQQLWGMVFLENYSCLALHKSGTLIVLAPAGILMVDREGRFIGMIDISNELEPYFADGNTYEEYYLAGDMDGDVYYVALNSYYMAVYEVKVTENESFSLSKVEVFQDRLPGKIYSGLRGIFFSDRSDGILYEYNGDGVLAPILRWQDSNLYETKVENVVQVSEDEFLVKVLNTDNGMDGYYRLKRTATKDMPERELIVVAATVDDQELIKSIAEFNMENQKYHVTLEIYGQDGLDASLVSSDPPDILSMSDLSIYKYTENDALEDLTGYLEKSSLVHKEDFLENVVSGYTIAGRLVCIPKMYYFKTLTGRKEQLGEVSGWTMEECMELTERYQEYCLIAGRSSQWLLSFLCREYCLERFVDWDKRSCSFDSREFKDLLDWLKKCGEKSNRLGIDWNSPEGWENSLLNYGDYFSLIDHLRKESEVGEELTLIGFPTADGEILHRPYIREALAIVSKSTHKEGAWTFVEYFLSREENIQMYPLFPTNKEKFQEQLDYYTTPNYVLGENGEKLKLQDGTYNMRPKIWLSNGEQLGYLEEKQLEGLLQAIESLDFTPAREEEDIVMDIVEEETGYYFDGLKGFDEVAGIIQNRVSVLLGEG